MDSSTCPRSSTSCWMSAIACWRRSVRPQALPRHLLWQNTRGGMLTNHKYTSHNRYAPRPAVHLPPDPTREAGDDVLRHDQQDDPPYLQELLPKSTLCTTTAQPHTTYKPYKPQDT